jgi:cystinosin
MPLVRFNDVAYGVHGLALAAFNIIQIYCFGYRRSRGQRLGRLTKLIIVGGLVSAALASAYAWEIKEKPNHFELIDLATILGNVKVIFSVTKYIPQVYHIHRRRSTAGWSMASTQMDFIGGLLSIAQLFLDGYIKNDLQGVWNNPIKLCLGVVSCRELYEN